MKLHELESEILTAGLPKFKAITPAQFMPAIESMIKAGEALLANVSSEVPEKFTWEVLLEPYVHFIMRFDRILTLGAHLESVSGEQEWRSEYAKSIEPVSAFFSKWGHSFELYSLFAKVAQHDAFHLLNPDQQLYVKHYVRDAELAGVHLKPAQKAKLKAINAELAKASNQFSNNVLDATDAWHYDCKTSDYLDGLPGKIIEIITGNSPREVIARVTLKADVVQAVLMHSDKRDLREMVYKAWVARASDVGPHAGQFDNTEMISTILKLRQQKAKLLGFESYSELSLVPKDAGSVEVVINFLEHLGDKAKVFALKEKEALIEFAKQELSLEKVEPWDAAYVAEKMRCKLYKLDQEEVQKYLPIDYVLDAFFDFIESMYGIYLREDKANDTYHPDVLLYNIFNESGVKLGSIYLDLYARTGKRGGAWVNDYQSRAKFNSEQNLPVVFLVCNFTPSFDDEPAYLTHSDLVTLFHEFGHGMHCILTKVNTYGVSGIDGVAWDLVEWPSQWMENWCWSRGILENISYSHRRNSRMPAVMINALKAARNFNSGLHVLRQVQYALTDIMLHSSPKVTTAKKAAAVHAEVLSRYAVWPEFKDQRFLHAFSHIFDGGYASGYYSYLWAEAMAADSFLSMRATHANDYNAIGCEFIDGVLSVGGQLKVDIAFAKLFNRPMD